DKYEQEADRVADQVMRMADPQRTGAIDLAGAAPDGVQRLCAECEEEVRRQPVEDEEEDLQMKRASGATVEIGPGVQAQIGGLRGGGQRLAPALRGFFEPRFGHDFSQVHVHQGSQASEAARSVGARAYTLGQDVVFGLGEYRPESDPGRRLIAHELTHVIQQTGADRAFVQRQGSAELSTTEGQLLPAPPPASIGLGLAQPDCTPASEFYELQGTITSSNPACSVAGIKDLRREKSLLGVYRADHPLVGDDPCPGFPGVVDAGYWLDGERRIVEIDRTRVTIINICGDEEVLEIKGQVLGKDQILDAIGGAAPSEPTPDKVVEDAQGTRGRQCAVWFDANCDVVQFAAKSNAESPAADCDAVYKWDTAQEAYVKATDEQTGAQPVTQTPGQLERIAGIRLKTFQEGEWLATHCGDYPESHQFRD
ncbi:MAG: DUF4157 domain-containing protein, partial [Geminicoccaceae bacterium]